MSLCVCVYKAERERGRRVEEKKNKSDGRDSFSGH